jgi:hypothetical protein
VSAPHERDLSLFDLMAIPRWHTAYGVECVRDHVAGAGTARSTQGDSEEYTRGQRGVHEGTARSTVKTRSGALSTLTHLTPTLFPRLFHLPLDRLLHLRHLLGGLAGPIPLDEVAVERPERVCPRELGEARDERISVGPTTTTGRNRWICECASSSRVHFEMVRDGSR